MGALPLHSFKLNSLQTIMHLFAHSNRQTAVKPQVNAAAKGTMECGRAEQNQRVQLHQNLVQQLRLTNSSSSVSSSSAANAGLSGETACDPPPLTVCTLYPGPRLEVPDLLLCSNRTPCSPSTSSPRSLASSGADCRGKALQVSCSCPKRCG